MKRSLVWLAVLAMALFGFACTTSDLPIGEDGDTGAPDGDETDGDSSTDPRIDNPQQGACKSVEGEAKAATTADGSENPTANAIEGVVVGDRVTIIHHNAVYPCEAQISFALEGSGTALTLTEVNSSPLVSNCVCPMDLSVDIVGLQRNVTYTIDVWDEFHETLFGTVEIFLGDCQTTCVTDADCANLPIPLEASCSGRFICGEGLCSFRCGQDTPCESDLDCPSGYQCVWYAVPMEAEVPPSDDPTGTGAYCASDADCALGQWCDLGDCACPDVGSCMSADGTILEMACSYSDEYKSCPEGYDCVMPPCPMCAGMGQCVGGETREYGVCEPLDTSCRVAQDCLDLPTPYRCPGLWECMNNVCSYSCTTGECLSNEDCPSGYHCEATYPEDDPTVGGTTDPESDGQTEPAWAYGVCVMDEINQCQVFGGECMDPTTPYLGGCPEGWSPVDAPTYMALCASGQTCCQPTGQECRTDEDCALLAGDDPAYPGQNLSWACINGMCEYYEICPTPECYSDADCGEGFVCMATSYCPPDGGECCGSAYCEYQGRPCASSADCEAGQICLDGLCIWNDPSYCYSDADCPEGTLCSFDAAVCPTPCTDAYAPCNLDECYGQCIPDSTCACPDLWAPVCGWDGVTYPNECSARCLGVEVAYYGECIIEGCEQDEATGLCLCGGYVGYVCPAGMECVMDDPTCGSDGADCLGHCYGATECVCTEEYAPVCGENGVTYSNFCFAECAHVNVAYDGECVCPDIAYAECAEGEEMMCETDPSTNCPICYCTRPGAQCYSSSDCPQGQYCTTEEGDCLPAYDCDSSAEDCFGAPACVGTCQVKPDECVCDQVYAPVCGDNGVTYSNECYARCAGAVVINQGSCRSCRDDSQCAEGFFCNTCPPDPNCPACDVCGPAFCQRAWE